MTARDRYLWITLINNASVTLALYYLLYYYRASHRSARLRLANPFGKFVAVKVILYIRALYSRFTFVGSSFLGIL